MNPRPKQESILGSPDKKDPTERAKTIIISSYKDQTTRKIKKCQQKEQTGKNLEDTQTNKNKSSKNKQRTPMWNQHTYDVGTWTKDKIEMELLLGKMSWLSIVSRTPK